MKKIGSLLIVVLLCVTSTACAQSDAHEVSKAPDQTPNQKEQGYVVLNDETIALFKKGKVKGIPFPLRDFPIDQVIAKWGKPDKQIDHEDIQVYVYQKKGQNITFTVDETNTVNYYTIDMNMSFKEVNQKLGSPYKVKKSTRLLRYPMGNYVLQVEDISKDKVWISLDTK
ncbi:DUF4309 domain-containing protein [Kroppenstedtia pulmonis]|uniref:DUF4309 domain-containing protein n=1 Tax=Kroppenstedtia pulmonis TaxID=1380685 RepID=A0A7D3XRR0_9BACL|nr:DUF4309 domain-containing protein [Kroppenstedtia pulmonis]QKG85402.1 DUF4309 domain-containing protein [Kroppenstedtia pulmonis]